MGESDIVFWDIATNTDKVQTSMKEMGFAFEIGYYYAVGLVIFAIVIFYSVHFPPVCFAGLLYFNCKVCNNAASLPNRFALLAVCLSWLTKQWPACSTLSTSTTCSMSTQSTVRSMFGAVDRWAGRCTTWCSSRCA
eukprot:COSAG06_NODE_3007_length_5966_cov_13.663371_3_plen_136_part_00